MKCKKCQNDFEIGGAAITPYTCEKCGNTFMYMLTKTPKVCAFCSEKYHVCESCGAVLYADEILERTLTTVAEDTGISASKLLKYAETGKITKKDFKVLQEYFK